MNHRTVPEPSDPLQRELADLKIRLEEAESTIEAIRTGGVDALVVSGRLGNQVFMLQGADEPYRIFVEQMPDGAVTVDASGVVLYCNRSFAEMAGEQLERVIGTQLSHFVPDLPEQLAGDLSGLGRFETRLIGSERSVTVLAAAFPFEIDEVRGHAVTFTDLTEQKSRETALTRATVELEGFCHSVSHDLRAPLRAMIGNAQIVIEDFGHLLPGEAAKDLLQITKSANYLGRLMDDLLNHSRLAGQEIVGQTVDMSALAHEIAQQLGARQYPNVTWDIQPGLIACGDARFLNMAIYNLMANGAKFSARSDDAQIKFGQDPESGAFFVQDNGIGFDMQYASKLFVPFERLHRQADFDGTGIGLANVKRIVGLHGGEVWAQSRPGEGTTFYFTLP